MDTRQLVHGHDAVPAGPGVEGALFSHRRRPRLPGRRRDLRHRPGGPDVRVDALPRREALDPGAAVPHRARPADARRRLRLASSRTTGVGRDLYENAQNATRAMIDHLDGELRPLARGRLPAVLAGRRPEDLRDRRRGPVTSSPPCSRRRSSRSSCSRERGLEDALGDRGGGGAALAGARRASPRPRRFGFGRRARRRRTRRSCSSAFWAMSAVETSSAVPVLPATVTPGIAAARAGAAAGRRATIMSRTWPATFALTTRLRAVALARQPGLDAHALVGDRRRDARPSRAGWRGRVSWPIAAGADGERLSLRSFGIVLDLGRGDRRAAR